MGNLKNVKNIYSVISLCIIFLGAFLMVKPEISANIFYKGCGVVLIIFGLVKLMGYFAKDFFQLAFQYDFALGCISSLLGIILMLKTEKVIELAAICIGIFILADALLRVQTAFDAKNFGIEKWWMLLVVALFVASIGALIVIMPFKSGKMMVAIFGLNLCIYGVLNFLTVQTTVMILNRKKNEEYNNTFF